MTKRSHKPRFNLAPGTSPWRKPGCHACNNFGLIPVTDEVHRKSVGVFAEQQRIAMRQEVPDLSACTDTLGLVKGSYRKEPYQND